MTILSEKKALIDKLDLSLIKAKLCLPYEKGGYGWTEKEALEVIAEYRKFLFDIYCKNAQLKNNQPVRQQTIQQIVDVVWHTHILFTKKYHEDCDRIFGYYLHHDPIVDG